MIDYKEFIGAGNRFGDNLAGRYGYLRFNALVHVNPASGAWMPSRVALGLTGSAQAELRAPNEASRLPAVEM